MASDPVTEQNKALARSFWDGVFNQGNVDLVDQLLAQNYTFNGRPQSFEAIKQWAKQMRAARPDLHFALDDLVAEGDKVAVRWTQTFTDQKTKQAMMVSGTNILTILDGKAISNWQNGGTPQDEHPVAPAPAGASATAQQPGSVQPAQQPQRA